MLYKHIKKGIFSPKYFLNCQEWTLMIFINGEIKNTIISITNIATSCCCAWPGSGAITHVVLNCQLLMVVLALSISRSA